ncbi:MAG: hypothetical protein JWR10_4794 [Rubritepida sp.]|nr:hypothetical protein [Rubritepida sp.]
MISIHQASVPPSLRALGVLSDLLGKGAAHCEARSIDPAVMLQSRLYLDMLPLTKQVQIASDSANRMGARIAGVPVPSMPDIETTFTELQKRLADTMAFLKSLKPEQFEGGETREIAMPVRGGELKLSGLDYIQGFALPNLYFHVTTAYAIMRHNGVELGKMDYLGNPPA